MSALRFVGAVQMVKKYVMWMMLAVLAGLVMPGHVAHAQTAAEASMLRIPPPPDENDPPFNDSQAIRRSVPQTMVTNGLYDVSITMKNTGTLRWLRSQQYRLGTHNSGVWGIERVEFGSSEVAAGGSATFTFQVRAPSTPGSYDFRWQMLQEGVEWFGMASATTVTVREPINNAGYVSHYQVMEMQTGQRYDVSVTMHNNGETTWSRAQQYTLMAQAPHNNMTWGLNRVAMPVEEVRPGESVTFVFPVTAPATAGTYVSQWGMQREGHGSFGASTAPVMVNVVAPPPLVNHAQAVSMAVPDRMVTGKQYNVAVTMQNIGTTTWTPGANYKLGSQNPHDNLLWGLGRIDVTAPVAPGQQHTFNFSVTAPAAGDYSMQWGMVQEYVTWFGFPANRPVTVTEDLGNVTFIHTDGLGSPVARTDGSGKIISRTRYEPYGYVASGATPTIGFTGHVNDADTGLTYMQQRYYDPVAGRFLSIDPVVTDANSGGSFNRYSYANNSPYRFIDPDGRSAYEKFKALGLAVRNGHLSVHPVTGIPFRNGFPDFSSVAVQTVSIQQSGKVSDFAAANAAAGLAETPKGFTWHHVEDGKTMQLVPTDVHAKTGHTGGASLARAIGTALLAAIAGDTAAEVLTGNKPATVTNGALSAQDFLLNLIPFSMSIGSAGEGSDKIPLPPPHRHNDDDKTIGPSW